MTEEGIGQQTIERINAAAKARHGVVLQPMQVQELTYILRSLVDENKFLIDRLEMGEETEVELEGQIEMVGDTYNPHLSEDTRGDEEEVEEVRESTVEE